MVFSSNLFLFVFLPFFISIYFGSPGFARNAVVLAASIVFYAFGAGSRPYLPWMPAAFCGMRPRIRGAITEDRYP